MKKRMTYRRQADLDYTRGTFLITIATQPRRDRFGEIRNHLFHPSAAGRLIETEVERLGSVRGLTLLASQVMPDHLHLVPTLSGERAREIGSFIRSFKGMCTKSLRRHGWVGGSDNPWEPNFHDWVLPTPWAIARACAYVRNNPGNWKPPYWKA